MKRSCAVVCSSSADCDAAGERAETVHAGTGDELAVPDGAYAAPAKGRVAWVFNVQGRRNLWVAEPAADGNYKVRQATSYKEDDGQDLGQLSLVR